MSYILDALKKSERERLGRGAAAAGPEAPAGTAAQRRWQRTLAALLTLNLGLAGFLFWWLRPSVAELPAEKTLPAVEAGETAKDFDPTAARPPARDLAAEARLPSAPPASDAGMAALPATTYTATTYTPASPAAPVAAAGPAGAPDAARIPFLIQMPQDFQRSLPTLSVNIHVFAPDPGLRMLYINNREYRVGDLIQDGLRVDAIVQDGVVLSYWGTPFKLPRPR